MPLRVFVGSSSEGLEYARHLQAELESYSNVEVQRWDIGTFEPGGITLDSLIETTRRVDFAILVATGEDTVTTRGEKQAAVRDNIIFEYGMFLGSIGRERVYLLSVGDAKLPTDLSGLTRLIYQHRSDGNIRAGLNSAALSVEQMMRKLGRRPDASTEVLPSHLTEPRANWRSAPARSSVPSSNPLAFLSAAQISEALELELDWLCRNATSQGWSVVKQNSTLLKLQSPKGKEFVFRRTRPANTRSELRRFVAMLRANGLRINQALQLPAEISPLG